jgi:hypothetical protein
LFNIHKKTKQNKMSATDSSDAPVNSAVDIIAKRAADSIGDYADTVDIIAKRAEIRQRTVEEAAIIAKRAADSIGDYVDTVDIIAKRAEMRQKSAEKRTIDDADVSEPKRAKLDPSKSYYLFAIVLYEQLEDWDESGMLCVKRTKANAEHFDAIFYKVKEMDVGECADGDADWTEHGKHLFNLDNVHYVQHSMGMPALCDDFWLLTIRT